MVIERDCVQVGQVRVDIRQSVDQRADLRVTEVATVRPSTPGIERIDPDDGPLVSEIFGAPAVRCGLALDMVLVVSDDLASHGVLLPGGLTGCLRLIEHLPRFVEKSGLGADDSARRATAADSG